MLQKRYFANLSVLNDRVYSYNTFVAEICHETQEVKRLGFWSVTTSKHINYVASLLRYKVVNA
jgi:hypothetical protein